MVNNNTKKSKLKVKKPLVDLERCDKCHLFFKKQQNKKLKVCRCYDGLMSSSSELETFGAADSMFSSSSFTTTNNSNSNISSSSFANDSIGNTDSEGVVCIGDVCILK